MENLKEELEREIAKLKDYRREVRMREASYGLSIGSVDCREESSELTGWIDALKWVQEKLNEHHNSGPES